VDIVANRAHPFERLPFRIVECTVHNSRTGDIGTGFAASHRDQQRRFLRESAGKLLRLEVDADLLHRFDDFRMRMRGRLRSGRYGAALGRVGSD